MKNLTVTIALLLLVSMSFAQNYAPFSATTSKRFYANGNPVDNAHFFHALNANSSGDSIIFDQYFTSQSVIPWNIPLNDCQFWGGPSGKVLDTTWLGVQINWNSITKELILQNEASETILFDFSIPIGASSSFYANGSVDYQIQHTANTLETFYGVSDSVQLFEIHAFDNVGSPISSTLTNFQIKLSKNHGVLSFIDCYHFPAVEKSVELRGQTNPAIGDYQMTFDEAYPWQVGDVLQYSSSNTPPGAQYCQYAYHTLTVTDRIETTDSVIILYDALVQHTNTSLPANLAYGINYDPIRYKKGSPIWEKPWNMAKTEDPQISPDENGSEESMTLCSLKKQFVVYQSFFMYCDSCRCYGSYDSFGSYAQDRYYTENLGIYRYYSPQNGSTFAINQATLTYWNVNGEECGTFWNSLDKLVQFELSIAPNPTKDIVKIESDHPIDAIRVLDLSGRVIIHSPDIASNFTEISIASFEKGAYILEVTANGSTQTRTIIRE